MNIQKLMKQAQQMQERLMREQTDLELEVSVGGGMVTVRMNGPNRQRGDGSGRSLHAR